MEENVRSARPRPGRVAVVGGGIAGLAAAWHLQRADAEVSLFEASTRLGGVIRTVRRGGFLLEAGPNTLVTRDARVGEFIDALGLSEQLVRAPAAAARRYVVRDGRLMPLPTSPFGMLKTELFSTRAKLRLLAEPLIPRGSGHGDEESVAGFVRRRFGREVLDYAADPFVAGVHAGDPERLSIGHAFPLLAELENEHRSVILGAMRRMRRGPQTRSTAIGHTPISFRAGMESLPRALGEELGDHVSLGHRVVDVRKRNGGFTLRLTTEAGERIEDFDAVVFALPPDQLARMSVAAGSAAAALAEVPAPPLAVIALGFRREDVEHPLDGFGVLVPGREPFRLLGALFSSTLFPGRAPEGRVLLTCFLGGSRHPEDTLLDEPAQLDLLLNDLRHLLGVRAEPELMWRHHWPHAIPQYELGHGRVVSTLEELEARYPGLAIAGNVRRGISVGDTILSGLEAAERVAG